VGAMHIHTHAHSSMPVSQSVFWYMYNMYTYIYNIYIHNMCTCIWLHCSMFGFSFQCQAQKNEHTRSARRDAAMSKKCFNATHKKQVVFHVLRSFNCDLWENHHVNKPSDIWENLVIYGKTIMLTWTITASRRFSWTFDGQTLEIIRPKLIANYLDMFLCWIYLGCRVCKLVRGYLIWFSQLTDWNLVASRFHLQLQHNSCNVAPRYLRNPPRVVMDQSRHAVTGPTRKSHQEVGISTSGMINNSGS